MRYALLTICAGATYCRTDSSASRHAGFTSPPERRRGEDSARRSLFLLERGGLLGELLVEIFRQGCGVGCELTRLDERVRCAVLHFGALGLHAIDLRMRPEQHVDLHRLHFGV